MLETTRLGALISIVSDVLACRRSIFIEEQRGKERAEYGAYIIKTLEREPKEDYGSGFSVRQLELARQFYRIYSIANAVCSQLNWAQYRLSIKINDDYKREYYELETVHNA